MKDSNSFPVPTVDTSSLCFVSTDKTLPRDIEPSLATIRQAAAYWNIGVSTAKALIRDGKIPVTRLGPKIIRIHRSTLEAIAENGLPE